MDVALLLATHGISTGQIGNYSSPVEFKSAIFVIALRKKRDLTVDIINWKCFSICRNND